MADQERPLADDVADPNLEIVATIEVRYKLPRNPDERHDMYGTTDLGRCVEIDLDNDAAAFFMDADEVTVVGVRQIDGPDPISEDGAP